MRSNIPSVLLLLAAFVTLFGICQAWTKEDHEIFRLRDEVLEADGHNVTFYSLLGLTPSATQAEIKGAVRKKSFKLHPDKAIPAMLAKLSAPDPGTKSSKAGVQVKKGPSQKRRAQVTKEANERWARFQSVAKVLQNQDRERYDHFLRNGFPAWKGSGYYYARFRPGLGAVIVGLFVVFGGAGHYIAMYVSWKRQREFVERYVTHARKQAWGNAVPGIESIGATAAVPPPTANEEEEFGGPLNRRQKRMQEKESRKKDTGRTAKGARQNGISRPVEAEPITGPQGSRKKVIAQNGKVLIVDGAGDVFLEETTAEGIKQEFLLDPEEVPRPSVFDTAVFRLPIWLFNQTGGRLMDSMNGTSEMQDASFLTEDGADLTISTGGHDGLDTATALNPVSEKDMRKRKAKARR